MEFRSDAANAYTGFEISFEERQGTCLKKRLNFGKNGYGSYLLVEQLNIQKQREQVFQYVLKIIKEVLQRSVLVIFMINYNYFCLEQKCFYYVSLS